ncbi:MAG: hypothetical protein R3E01_36240 [Pirellulaceae bacterium]
MDQLREHRCSNLVRIAFTLFGIVAIIAQFANCATIDATWIGTSGDWGNSSLWSPEGVPNNTLTDEYRVYVTSGSSQVQVDTNVTINELVVGLGDQLTVVSGNRSLTLDSGSITNSGEIHVMSLSPFSDADIVVTGGIVTFQGDGRVSLEGDAARIKGDQINDRLINGSLHTIEGLGQIGANSMAFTNEGLVEANLPTAVLKIDPNSSGAVNVGTMRAANGGILSLEGGTFSNSGGSIEASSASTVRLAAYANVNDGSIATAANGTIEIGKMNETLVGTSLGGEINFHNVAGGTVRLSEGSALSLQASGTYTNDGEIHMASSSASISLLAKNGTVALQGNGRLLLAGESATIGGVASTDSFLNGPLHTIEGFGRIEALTNSGLAEANVAAMELQIGFSTSGVVNTGRLSADNGGILTLRQGTFMNTDGLIESLAMSTVRLRSAHVNGGTLRTTANSVIEIGTASAEGTRGSSMGGGINFQNVVGGTVRFVGNSSLVLDASGTYANDGEIKMDPPEGQSADLTFSGGTVTFQGSGILTLMGESAQIQQVHEEDRFVNGSHHTIQGFGRIGTITNQGLVEANVAEKELKIFPSASRAVNTGRLSADNGGMLTLEGGTFTNTNGLIESYATSTVRLSYAHVNGGTLKTTANSIIEIGSDSIYGAGGSSMGGGINFQNVVGGSVRFLGNSSVVLDASGTYTNDGEIHMNPPVGQSANAGISGGTVTLGGSGKLTLMAEYDASIAGADESDHFINGPLHTIEGFGRIGANSMAFTNQGVIHAHVPDTTLTIDPSPVGMENLGQVRGDEHTTIAIGEGDIYNQTTGQTVINGRMTVPGGLSIQGGRLEGNGTITGNVVTSAITSGGDAVGRLTIEGKYTQLVEGTLETVIAGPFGAYDQVVVTGEASIDGKLHVELAGGYTPPLNSTFVVLESAEVVKGEFSSFNLPKLPGNNGWTINYSPIEIAKRVELNVVEFRPYSSDVDPRSTFLRYYNDETPRDEIVSKPHDPIIIDLCSDLGAVVQPGDTLLIESSGGFHYSINPKETEPPLRNLVGVFAATDEILDGEIPPPTSGEMQDVLRVPTAIDAGNDIVTINFRQSTGLPAYPQGLLTDIPQDFSIAPTVRVSVPAGARYLMIGADDEFWSDNSSVSGDPLAIRVTRIPFVAGDFSGNTTVDAADYTIWKDNFGSSTNLAADGNRNGIIDAADYTIWKDNFGNTLLNSAANSVPEPCSIGLLVGLILISHRFLSDRSIPR